MTTTEKPSPSLQRRAVLAIALSAGLVAATGAQADAGLIDLTVVDRATGQQLQVWRHKGRLFVAGQPGARYSLRVANNTDARVLAVMSVDGVNILTGETAGYDQRGYVFDPYESYDISGWRKNMSEVAAFVFTPAARAAPSMWASSALRSSGNVATRRCRRASRRWPKPLRSSALGRSPRPPTKSWSPVAASPLRPRPPSPSGARSASVRRTARASGPR